MVAVARKARGRIVEFDWMFTRDELRHLRQAVFGWGSGVTGRYKCFDARVLSAISDATGETDTAFVLKEPKNTEWTNCTVSCAAEGELFRLRGHASFDIVFGYGSAGVDPDPVRSSRLGPTVQGALANSVGMLGWDLRLLREDRLRPVVNVLYGNPMHYGIQAGEPVAGPAIDVSVHFHGPFSALDEDGWETGGQ